MEDLRVRMVVRFKYDGGSNPGGYRLVEVTETAPGYLYGFDLEVGRNAYRQYRKEGISDLSVVAKANERVVLPGEVGLANHENIDMTTLKAVYKALNPDAKLVVSHIADKAGVILVKRDDLPRIDILFKATEIVVHLVNANGEGLHFTLDHELPFKEEYKVGAVLSEEQVEAFVKAVNGLVIAHENPLASKTNVGPSFTGRVDSPLSKTSLLYKDWVDMLHGRKG